MIEDTLNALDTDAADTLRFGRVDPDATSIYDITPPAVRRLDRTAACRRLIRAARQEIARLREAIAAGWDIGPELAHKERRLAALEASSKVTVASGSV